MTQKINQLFGRLHPVLQRDYHGLLSDYWRDPADRLAQLPGFHGYQDGIDRTHLFRILYSTHRS